MFSSTMFWLQLASTSFPSSEICSWLFCLHDANSGKHTAITWGKQNGWIRAGDLALYNWMPFIFLSSTGQSQFLLSACSSPDPRLGQIQSAVCGTRNCVCVCVMDDGSFSILLLVFFLLLLSFI